MALFTFCLRQRFKSVSSSPCLKQWIRFQSNYDDDDNGINRDYKNDNLKIDDEFRKLEILPVIKKREKMKAKLTAEIVGPRYKRMAVDNDWSTVWPSARTFHPATVPLPLHQGYIESHQTHYKAPPGKFNNPELMKIPNFLHLGPPAIKKHCAVLKKFCTQWPKGLETDEACDELFPIQIHTNDFLWSTPSIREPRARIVTLKVKMSRLKLDYHAKDKLIRLLYGKYKPKTDEITIVANRCPLRKQNYDYAHYLLTAAFYESWKTEDWEMEKTEDDWERYYWEKSRSRNTIVNYMKQVNPDISEEEILKNDDVKNYANAVMQLHDIEENDDILDNYKKSVIKLMF